jgi:Ca2+-binding EF-hand superfamily protein
MTKEHEETRLRDQFRRVDTDHSGKVDRHELKYLLNRLTGCTPTEDELDEMMDGGCGSVVGLIDFEEFRGIYQKAMSGEELRFAELSRVLTEFDDLSKLAL